jgi:NAD(P)-dependent dehydrogenase (short-subunit alcohol dehydrogenase family)
MRLNGKVAIVTGGTSGIGRCIVERFVEEGAIVVFTGRRKALGENIAEVVGATFVEADAGNERDVERTINIAVAVGGRVDVLVNNAGNVAQRGPLATLSLENLDRTLAIHVRGALAHIKHVSTLMSAQRHGSIINMGSVAGHRTGYSSSLIYAVAKAALIHLSRCAAMELGESNVRVNSISPGAIATGIFAKSMGQDDASAEASVDKIKSTIAKAQAIPRAGMPQDVASAAVFLASDESTFVNGEDMVIDGGMIWGRRFSETAAAGAVMRKLFE